MGVVRDPCERHRSRAHRRHRRRAAPHERIVAPERRTKLPPRTIGHDRRYCKRGVVPVLGRRVVRERCHAGRRRGIVAAVGAYSRRVMTIPTWAAGVCAGVHAVGCRDVVYVPDNPLSHVLRVFGDQYPDIRLILATREEEAFGIAAGLYLGGRRPAVLLQSSGLGNSLNALTSLLVPYQIPVMMVVSMRGDESEWNSAQMPMGRAVRSILESIDIPHVTAESAEGVAETVRLAGTTAFGTRRPGACLLPRRLTTSV